MNLDSIQEIERAIESLTPANWESCTRGSTSAARILSTPASKRILPPASSILPFFMPWTKKQTAALSRSDLDAVARERKAIVKSRSCLKPFDPHSFE